MGFPFGGRPDQEIAPKGEAREWEWCDGEMPEAVGPKTAQKSGRTRAKEGISGSEAMSGTKYCGKLFKN